MAGDGAKGGGAEGVDNGAGVLGLLLGAGDGRGATVIGSMGDGADGGAGAGVDGGAGGLICGDGEASVGLAVGDLLA